MKKPVFAALLALLYCVSGAAQNTNEWHTPKGLPSGNEIGVRYGAQLFMGDGRGPEFEAISIDYARYNYYNIGFRTGLNLFFDDEVCDYYSIPMQFTWRTERIRGWFSRATARPGRGSLRHCFRSSLNSSRCIRALRRA